LCIILYYVHYIGVKRHGGVKANLTVWREHDVIIFENEKIMYINEYEHIEHDAVERGNVDYCPRRTWNTKLSGYNMYILKNKYK